MQSGFYIHPLHPPKKIKRVNSGVEISVFVFCTMVNYNIAMSNLPFFN